MIPYLRTIGLCKSVAARAESASMNMKKGRVRWLLIRGNLCSHRLCIALFAPRGKRNSFFSYSPRPASGWSHNESNLFLFQRLVAATTFIAVVQSSAGTTLLSANTCCLLFSSPATSSIWLHPQEGVPKGSCGRPLKTRLTAGSQRALNSL